MNEAEWRSRGNYSEIVDCVVSRMQMEYLKRRIDEIFCETKQELIFNGSVHRERYLMLMQEKRAEIFCSHPNYAAAVFLLSADNGFWERAKRNVADTGIYFDCIRLGGVTLEQYILFHAAKDVYNGTKHIRLSELAQDICAAPLLAQMKGTCFFPEALKDELLFQKTTKEIAEDLEKEVPFPITVDVGQYTVAFHFNDGFEELEELKDITIPCYEPTDKCSGGYFRNESLARQMGACSAIFDETNEMIFRRITSAAVKKNTKYPIAETGNSGYNSE